LAHFTLANALRAEGKFDEAIAHYREVLRLAPDNAEHTATWAVCISPKESWTKQSLISPRR
jgi:cytochrome c-type biogenesis protein CcmH/NrfG